jgi:hypothetical protein
MPQVSPVQVSARSYNSTALNVSWLPIEQTRERIRGKLIGYRVIIVVLLLGFFTESLFYLTTVAYHFFLLQCCVCGRSTDWVKLVRYMG